MKRILLTFLTLLIAIISYSQNFPIKFMGIPVTGTRSDFIKSLQTKGFSTNSYTGKLHGQFNGIWVELSIHTNKDKVDRIIITNDKPFTEQDIKNQYNTLVDEFNNNKKYINPGETVYTIPEEENISYEIAAHNKRYEATYYQMIDMNNHNDYDEFTKYFYSKVDSSELSKLPQNEKLEKIKEVSGTYIAEVVPKRVVWFMIKQHYNDYYINLYYDNEYNRPHGEDL